MNKQRKILLTFDYELSLGGKSGSVNNCILKPTNLILDILKKHHALGVFFIDITYLKRLEEVSIDYDQAKTDLIEIKNQINRMVNEGHYVFHHIHPHWIDATYNPEENQWDLIDRSKYTVYQLSESEREKVFSDSYRILTDITSQSSKPHSPDGFRAGGLYIEPFSSFKQFFIKYGIKYDFSTVPYLIKKHDFLFYDFSRCPEDPYYNFEDEAAIKDNEGRFKEFSITQFKLKGIRKIINGIYYRLNNLEGMRFTDGQSISIEYNSSDNSKSIKNYFVSDNLLSIELINPVLITLYKKIVKKNDYLHFISHPKLLSLLNLKQFDLFLDFINKKYQIEYDFKKFEIE